MGSSPSPQPPINSMASVPPAAWGALITRHRANQPTNVQQIARATRHILDMRMASMLVQHTLSRDCTQGARHSAPGRDMAHVRGARAVGLWHP